MLRHFAVATFRNLAANKLLSAISIAGLAVGIAVALLSGLVIRNQARFDHFIPGHGRIVMLTQDSLPTGMANPRAPACLCDGHRSDTGQFLAPQIPEIESMTRLYLSGWLPDEPLPILANGMVRSAEEIYWADPNTFDLFRLPVLHGELATALARPDGIVLPRAMARKYFGRDNAVGAVLTLDGQPMTVRAVVEDLPAEETTLQSGIFASGLSNFSRMLPRNAVPGTPEARARTAKGASPFATVYFRMKPGADLAAIGKRIASLMQPRQANLEVPYALLPLGRINLTEKFHPGIHDQLVTAGVIGLTVLLIAVINFINLMTVIAARREKEVGVRKACGAGRLVLMSQFLGEAMIAVALGAAIALALAEWLMPLVNAFLLTGMSLDYGQETLLLPLLLLAVAGLSILSGAYPAFLLSTLRPATTLRGWVKSGGSQWVRGLLVGLQFAILVILGIAAITFWRQHQYAVRDAMRVDGEQVLLLRVVAPLAPPGSQPGPLASVLSMADPRACPAALVERLRALPGIRTAVCSGEAFLKGNMGISWYATPTTAAQVVPTQLDPALFDFYGIQPIAGNLADAGRGMVLNQAAVRQLGFASPADAIGKSWMNPKSLREMWFPQGGLPAPDTPQARVVAVVPDFGFQPVSETVRPAVMSPLMVGMRHRMVHLKLTGAQIPETLAAIDRVWRESGQEGAPERFFLNDYMQQQYLALGRQARLFTIICGISLFMACLGLVGIAVATADRRTKEVGVRKAMGAGKGEIVMLMLWQFSRPVLLANLIAWPVAFWAMQRWLSGFAYHIELSWWMFAAASLGALLVALLAVAGQAIRTARQKPVMALRYE